MKSDREIWLAEQEQKEKEWKGCTVNFLYFIIFCIFLFICHLAIIDASSPLTTYPSGSGSMIIPFSSMI